MKVLVSLTSIMSTGMTVKTIKCLVMKKYRVNYKIAKRQRKTFSSDLLSSGISHLSVLMHLSIIFRFSILLFSRLYHFIIL